MLSIYTRIVFWALRTNYSMFTCMYVCEYVHTHILTYIHTRVSSQALHITVMEIIRIKAFIYLATSGKSCSRPAAAAAWGGRHNDMTFNVLSRILSRTFQTDVLLLVDWHWPDCFKHFGHSAQPITRRVLQPSLGR